MRWIAIFLLFLWCVETRAQEVHPYELKWKREIALLGSGLVLSTTGFLLTSAQDPLTEREILSLNSRDIWSFDRGAVDNFSTKSGTASDVLRAAAWIAPVAALTSNRYIRQDFKIIGVMALETYFLNTGITNLTKLAAGRVRPFVYNPDVATERKTNGGAKRSYFSGHTSAAASFAFLMAKIVNDYSENVLIKSIVWSSAFALPAMVGYLRVRAGKHFPTDVISGYLVGGLIGYLIPKMHHRKENEERLSFSVNPLGGQAGVSLTWKL